VSRARFATKELYDARVLYGSQWVELLTIV
jgi:hypothetical protein